MIVCVRHIHIIGKRRQDFRQNAGYHCKHEDPHTHTDIKNRRILLLLQLRDTIQPYICRNQKQKQKPAIVITVTIRSQRRWQHRLPHAEEKCHDTDNHLQRPALHRFHARRQKRCEQIHNQICRGKPVVLRLNRQHIIQPVIDRKLTRRNHAGTDQHDRYQQRIKKNLCCQRHHTLRFPCRLHKKISTEQHIAVHRNNAESLYELRRIIHCGMFLRI